MNKVLDPYNIIKPERLEFLTDGVFAIAMTLLVLDIRVPVVESLRSEGDVCTLLIAILPKLLTYVLSFLTLANLWSAYSIQQQYIHRCDRRLFVHATFFLLFISLIPFTTAFVSEHFNYKTSIAILWLNFTLNGMALATHWAYAYKNNFVNLSAEEAAGVNAAFQWRGKTTIPVFAISALLCFMSTYVSIILFLVISLCFLLGYDQKLRSRFEASKG